VRTTHLPPLKALSPIIKDNGDGLFLVIAIDDLQRPSGACSESLRTLQSYSLDRRARQSVVAFYIDGEAARARARELAVDNRRTYGVMRLETVMELAAPPVTETNIP